MKAELDLWLWPRLQVAGTREIELLYSSALEVLQTSGVKVLHPEALELLRRSGAELGGDGMVRLKPKLVERAVLSAPKRLVIHDRQGKAVLRLGGENTGGANTYYGTGSDLRYTYDPYSGELRLTVAADIGRMARVADALPNLDFVMSYGIPSDCPLERVYRTEFAEMVANTVKPIVFTSDNGEEAKRIIGMAALVAGGVEALREKPFILGYSQPTSPLKHSADALGKLLACAEAGVPAVYPPGLIPGATAPATLAGAIVQSLAEALSGLVIHQLKAEGAPIVLCGAHGCMDMRTGINVYAGPERLLTEAVLAGVYQRFGIPTWGFGGCSDAQLLDEQAGMEFALLSLWACLCGVNLAHDVGYLGSGMVGDLRAIVFNDEIAGYVRHACRGVRVNAESLALGEIGRVGADGNFMGEEHTLRHFRQEFWQPLLCNRLNLSGWREQGGKNLRERLAQRTRDILESHSPEPLERGIAQAIEQRVQE